MAWHHYACIYYIHRVCYGCLLAPMHDIHIHEVIRCAWFLMVQTSLINWLHGRLQDCIVQCLCQTLSNSKAMSCHYLGFGHLEILCNLIHRLHMIQGFLVPITRCNLQWQYWDGGARASCATYVQVNELRWDLTIPVLSHDWLKCVTWLVGTCDVQLAILTSRTFAVLTWTLVWGYRLSTTCATL